MVFLLSLFGTNMTAFSILGAFADAMDKFHALFEEGNARPVQKLNDRPVFRDQKQNPR